MIIPDAMKGKNTWVRLFSTRNMSPHPLGPGQGAIPSRMLGGSSLQEGRRRVGAKEPPCS